MHRNYLLAICVIILISCGKDDYQYFINGNKENNTTILKERDSKFPLILSNRKESRGLKSSIGFNNCLGTSFKCNSYPLGNMEDLGNQVIDIEKFSKNYPSYFKSKRIGQGSAESFAYSSFSRYTENSKTTNKINGGFALDLGLFSLGAKSKMEEVFSTSKIEEEKRIFGELSVLIKDSCYTMQTSSNIIKNILLNYLSNDFKEELYNTTPSELFMNYGGFVLSDFIVGGRAIALYTGTYNSSETSETREKDMSTDISASYGFKMKDDSDGKVSGNLGFGQIYSNGTSTTNKIESLETSIRTIGGSPEFASFSIPKNIDNLNVDISKWITSLNDKSTHSIIEISDNGLIPLTNFILEANLKNDIISFYQNGVTRITSLQEPYLEIFRRQTSDQCLVSLQLVTRFGNRVGLDWLQTQNYPGLNNEIERYKEKVINKYSKIYKIKIAYREVITQTINSHLKDGYLEYPSVTDFYPFSEDKMKKFTWKENNTTYLLYSENNVKYAYSIHGDYLLDTYAMREFVNNLPSIEISPSELLKYTIVAL